MNKNELLSYSDYGTGVQEDTGFIFQSMCNRIVVATSVN